MKEEAGATAVVGGSPGIRSSEQDWQDFYEDYLASDAVGRWEKWCLLTRAQQEHFMKQFNLDPPPPKRRH